MLKRYTNKRYNILRLIRENNDKLVLHNVWPKFIIEGRRSNFKEGSKIGCLTYLMPLKTGFNTLMIAYFMTEIMIQKHHKLNIF